MKKTVSFFLIMVILVTWCVPLISAQDTESQTDTAIETDLDSLSEYTCEYNRDTKKIVLGGTVKHDVLLSHKQYRLEVYRILPGNSYENVISAPNAKPLASTEIAVRFEFSLDVNNSLERFSHYAVVLCSPQGERTLAARPHYAGIEDGYEYVSEDRFAFKGLQSSETALASSLNAGTMVIPVYLDRLLSDTSRGYIYSVGEALFYFDKTYIDELDCAIRSASMAGGRVYLQFLLPANGSEFAVANGKYMGALYDMPNVFSEEVLSRICAASEFLADRYKTYQSGRLSGVILGESIDDPIMNYCGSLSLDRYARLYSLYLTVVAYSIRVHQPSADIIVPFSSENRYSSNDATSVPYDAAELLERIVSIQDDGFSFPFDFNTMIHFVADSKDSSQITINTVEEYSKYLSSLREQYNSAPHHYMVCWNVPYEMAVTPLCANYSFLYYKLINDPWISSFIVSFSDCEANGQKRLSDLKPVLRNIDTAMSMSATASFSSYFGADTWDELIPNVSQRSYAVRNIISTMPSSFEDKVWQGSFSYFDFSRGDIDGWFKGSGCSSIKTEYAQDGEKVLRGTVDLLDDESTGELLCLYEYPEGFSYTPYISIRMSLAEEVGDANGLYRVTVSLGDDKNQMVTQTILSGGTIHTLSFDLRNYPTEQPVNYIKISISQIDGEYKTLSFRLYDMIGYSENLSDEELEQNIQEDRMAIRDMSEVGSEDGKDVLWWILVLLILVVSVVVGVLLCFRHEDEQSEEL